MIIDVHAHVWSLDEVDRLRREAREAGVEKVVVMDWPGIAGLRYPALEEVMPRGFDGMFFGVSLSVRRFEEGLERMERFLEDRRVVCIKLYPGYEPFYPNERRMYRVYELAQRFDVPVLFHSGETWEEVPSARLKYSRAIYIDEVAVSFPKVNFIIAHLSYPDFHSALEVIEKNSNVHGDISDLFAYWGWKYAKKHFEWVRGEVEKIIYALDGERILFGTDWPLEGITMKDYVALTKTLNIEEEDREKLLHKNALKIFKRLR